MFTYVDVKHHVYYYYLPATNRAIYLQAFAYCGIGNVTILMFSLISFGVPRGLNTAVLVSKHGVSCPHKPQVLLGTGCGIGKAKILNIMVT